MPTNQQILTILANEPAPLHRNKIAEKLGETSYRPFQTMLDRNVRQGLMEVSGDHEYSITEAGKKKLETESIVAEELDEERLGTTEYQIFIQKGKMTGVAPPELIKLTAEHIWAGGNYSDLEWVAKAFQEMGVRKDLAARWWNSWRSYLRQPIPASVPSFITEAQAQPGAKTEAKKGRTHILDETDKPIFVGEGLGDMSESDAVDLAKIRTARSKATAGAPQTPGSMADEVVKLFTAFREVMGEKTQGKSYMVRPGEEGIQVEEVDPGRPMILNYPQGDIKQKPTYFVNQDGEVQEVQPGHPIVIKQAPPPQQNQPVQYLIDKQTGQYQQVQPGQPIIIQTAPQNPFTPIQFDKDGKPIAPPNLETWIKIEDWKQDQQKKQERHGAQISLITGLKDLVTKATSAFSRMAEKK